MSRNITRGLLASAAGIALAASSLATAGVADAARGAARSQSLTVRSVPRVGAQLWLARYSTGFAAAMAVSPGGSRVYVTGFNWGSKSAYDCATLAYGG